MISVSGIVRSNLIILVRTIYPGGKVLMRKGLIVIAFFFLLDFLF